MDTSKTVDVVMCTYNGAKYLREQLDSIVEQTYPIHRLIVQDDRSTDDTVAIVKEYCDRYNFIELHINEHNLGYNLNFKTATMRATADFVALADQDDVWFKDKIARQVEAIGDYNICFSAHLRGEKMESAHKVEPQYSLKALLFHGFAGHTMLLRRDFAQCDEAWLGYIYYDWSLALNAYFHSAHAITYISEPLNWHRSHPDETALKQRLRRLKGRTDTGSGPLAPYIHGLRHYRTLQTKPVWKRLYTYIYDKTGTAGLQTEHRMSRWMLSPGPTALLRLCMTCMKYRRETYSNAAATNGVMGRIRGFFYPFIFAFNNTEFEG